MKRVMTGNRIEVERSEEEKTAKIPPVHELEPINELSGKLSQQTEEDKLMRSVLENDKETIDKGKLISDSINQGVGSLVPDIMFEQFVKNYGIAKKLYGPSIIRWVSGYDSDYVQKNIRIPEFRKELKKQMEERLKKLRQDKLIGRDGIITKKGFELASLVLYVEELDNLVPKGVFGEKIQKKHFIYGSKDEYRNYQKGDRYRDIALKRTVKRAIIRGRRELSQDDLVVFDRKKRGATTIVYAIDSSASMRGQKLEKAKKAGIALAFKACEEKDKVGLLAFGSEVKTEIIPTDNFSELLKEITKIRASTQTDFVKSIKKAIELFPDKNDVTKHLLLLTDAMPTVGKEPEKQTLEAVCKARDQGITISLVGVGLDAKGKKLAEKIAERGDGKIYIVKDLDDVDKIVLEDYYSLA